MFEAAEESGTKVKVTFHRVRLRESCWSDFFHVSSIQRDLGWKASHDSLNDSATALVKTSVSVSVIRIISAVKEWLKKYLHVKVGWGQEHTQAFRSNKSSRGLLNILYITCFLSESLDDERLQREQSSVYMEPVDFLRHLMRNLWLTFIRTYRPVSARFGSSRLGLAFAWPQGFFDLATLVLRWRSCNLCVRIGVKAAAVQLDQHLMSYKLFKIKVILILKCFYSEFAFRTLFILHSTIQTGVSNILAARACGGQNIPVNIIQFNPPADSINNV